MVGQNGRPAPISTARLRDESFELVQTADVRVRGSKSPLIDPKKKKELSRSVLGTSSANQI